MDLAKLNSPFKIEGVMESNEVRSALPVIVAREVYRPGEVGIFTDGRIG